jgi:hypothetical protein
MKEKSQMITCKSLQFIALMFLVGVQVAHAQEKPKVYVSDDYRLESSTPAYLWFYNQKGVLEKLNESEEEEYIGVIRAFAKSCECTVIKESDDADYVVVFSRYDIRYRPKLAEKKFIVMKVDGERLVAKGSVRRVSNIISDACKVILKDWQKASEKPRS